MTTSLTTVTTTDPADGTTLASYPAMGPDDVERAVARGAEAARAWGRVPVTDRTALLTAFAAHLRADAERYAALVTSEMGKPLAQSRGEVEKSAVTADYYAANARAILAPRPVEIDSPAGVSAFVTPEPIGLVLAVMPWNFPVWQVMRFAIPTLAAGNGVLLKHSPNVTGTALALAEAFAEVGFPAHLVTTLVVAEEDVPVTVSQLIADDRVAAVTLTGSTPLSPAPPAVAAHVRACANEGAPTARGEGLGSIRRLPVRTASRIRDGMPRARGTQT